MNILKYNFFPLILYLTRESRIGQKKKIFFKEKPQVYKSQTRTRTQKAHAKNKIKRVFFRLVSVLNACLGTFNSLKEKIN